MKRFSKVLLTIAAIALTAMLFSGCAPSGQAARLGQTTPDWYFHDIVAADVVQEYAKLPPPPDGIIIDVRSEQEFDEGHIFSAFNIPADQPDLLARLVPKNPDLKLIFYCDGPECDLSHKSARQAEQAGYKNVKVFAGGIAEWKKITSLTAIAKTAKAEGFGIVSYEYVKSKVTKGIRNFNEVVIIDARPERMYSDGHIPSALSFPSMTFSRDYPEFEKLNIAKNTEIILGIGRECPLSFKNAMKLKEKGYTNLKLYINPPVWLSADYQEIDLARARKLHSDGVVFIDSRPDLLFKKGSIEGAVSIPASNFDKFKERLPADKTKPVVSFCQGYSCVLSHQLAGKMRELGYRNVVVYAGGYPEWEKAAGAATGVKKAAPVAIAKGKGEGTIEIAAFEKILKESADSILLIDVRDPAEVSSGAFKSAQNITIEALDKKIKTLPADKPIVFVCATGARSGEAYFMVKDVRPELKEVYYLDAEVSYNKDGSYKIIQPN